MCTRGYDGYDCLNCGQMATCPDIAVAFTRPQKKDKKTSERKAAAGRKGAEALHAIHHRGDSQYSKTRNRSTTCAWQESVCNKRRFKNSRYCQDHSNEVYRRNYAANREQVTADKLAQHHANKALKEMKAFGKTTR